MQLLKFVREKLYGQILMCSKCNVVLTMAVFMPVLVIYELELLQM
jgi:hypothetical protein